MIHEKIGDANPEYNKSEGKSVRLNGPSRQRKQMKWYSYLWVGLTMCAVIVGAFILETLYSSYQPRQTPGALSGWMTYMANNERSGFNASETIITPTSAPHLKLKWTHTVEGSFASIASQPVEANGLLYWGAWNGFEYATNPNNQVVWSSNLGTTTAINCAPPHLGVTSTATIATVQINGAATSVDFVGGGDGNLYALDAYSGSVIWKTRLGTPPASYLWSSPAIYHGSIYMGISSDCDIPLVQGGLAQLDPVTGKIEHIFNTVPHGCVGASVWTSPTIDEAAGTLYISTGNGGDCSQPEQYGTGLVELRASDLSLLHSWQILGHDLITDGDFTTTPTLFSTSTGIPMVGIENKNGKYYAFKRDDLSQPIWKAKVGTRRGDQPSSAWDGHRLYVGGETAVTGGYSCHGRVAALNPDTGAFIWQHCLGDGSVVGAIITVPGLVAYAAKDHLNVLDAASGQLLFTYKADGSYFWSWPSISNGVLYIGSTDGKLYAFAP